MAIPILNHMDFQKSAEIRNVRLHNQAASGVTSPGTGQIIYDSGTVKFYNGSAWVSLSASSGTMSNFTLTGDSGSNQTIEDGNTLDIAGGNGISTVVGATDTLTVNLDASITTVTSITNASLVIGRDADNDIDFSSDNKITFRAAGADQVQIKDGAFVPITDNDIDLGSSTYEFKNAYFDGTVTSDAFAGPLTGNVTGNVTGDVTGDVTGNADTATALATARAFTTTGDVVLASANFDGSANFTTTATIQANAVEGSMLNNNVISGQTALTSGLASTDELAVSDAGTLKRMDVSVLQTYMQNNLTFTSNTDVDVNESNLRSRLADLTENVTIGDGSDVQVTITGDLVVSGTTTTVNSTTVDLNDHNIVLDSGNTTSAVVNGAGITIEGGSGDDATFTYNTTGPKFELKLGSSYEDLQVDQLIAASLDISGNVDVDGTLEADAITVNGTALNEVINDRIGAVVTAGEGIDVTNNDGANTVTIAGEDSTASNKGIVIVAAGEGIDVSYSSGTATVSGEDASATNKGIVEIADSGEAQAGTSDSVVLTPAKLADTRVTATIDVSDSSFTSNLYAEVTHNLGSEDVIVQLFDSSTKETVYADVARTDKANSANNNKIKITFASAPANDIEVLITSIQGATAGSVAYS